MTTTDRQRHIAFWVGLAVSLWMVWRGQFGEDQFYLMVRGWLLYAEGWWVPFGNPMSGGGFEPGGLTALLTGLPLFVREDPRAVGLSILAMHVLAYALLDRTMRDVLSPRGRLLLCVFYWLNPWRMYFSAFVWNPNWLFLAGAVHLWSAFRQRRRASFRASFVHVLAVGLAFQLHGSFLILAIASVLLFWRGFVRVHWGGVLAATLTVALSLVPWALTAMRHPEILPISHDGFLGRGLLHVYPVLRGVGYWLRYPVLHYGRTMTVFDFTPTFGAAADVWLTPIVNVVTKVIGPITVVVSLTANVWFWRRHRGRRWARFPSDGRERAWVDGYVRWTAIAALVTFALSPTTIMMWQALIVAHAAVLPVVLWLEALSRTRIGPRLRVAVRAWAAALVLIAVAMGLAAPQYRPSGRWPFVGVTLRRSHPMLQRLGVLERNHVVIAPDASVDSRLLDGPNGWSLEDVPDRPRDEKM